jgi:hypothetical protein
MMLLTSLCCAQTDIILGFLTSALDQEDNRSAATAVVGIAKLLLSGMVTDEEVCPFFFPSLEAC